LFFRAKRMLEMTTNRRLSGRYKTSGSSHARPANSVLRRYVLALAGQSTLSVFNFALNIFLVRSLSAHDYGSYAITWVFAMLAGYVIGSLTASPLIIFGTARVGRRSRFAVEVLLSSVTVLLLLILSVVVAVLSRLVISDDVGVCASATGFVCAFTARNYTRTFAYARQMPQVAVRGDAFTVLTAAAVLAVSPLWHGSIATPQIFAALALGNLAAMAAEIRMLRLGLRLTFRRASLRRYRAIWADVRWSLLGSTTTLLQGQAHSFLVTLTYGPAAYAPLAAGQVLFGPVRIMMTAWSYIMQPEVVLAVREKNRSAVMQNLRLSACSLAGVVVSLGVALAALWSPVFDLLYAGKYNDQSMRWIVTCWCVITLCSAIYCGPSGILQTMRRYRLLAMATVYGAALSTLGVAVALAVSAPQWSLLGVLAAESFLAIYIVAYALRCSRALTDSDADGRDGVSPAKARTENSQPLVIGEDAYAVERHEL
jgi:O-antigen/teichoic acid export membrane protein